MSYDMYLYGMILRTNSFLLEGDYPEANTYAEIRKEYSLPGGETGTCATVLLGLGRSVKMDGTFMGKSTMPFMKKTSLSCTGSGHWHSTSARWRS